MKALYYTTRSTATIVQPFWYHSQAEFGNIIYQDGTSIKDYIDGEDEETPDPPTGDAVLATSTNKVLLTSNNLKIALNI